MIGRREPLRDRVIDALDQHPVLRWYVVPVVVLAVVYFFIWAAITSFTLVALAKTALATVALSFVPMAAFYIAGRLALWLLRWVHASLQ